MCGPLAIFARKVAVAFLVLAATSPSYLPAQDDSANRPLHVQQLAFGGTALKVELREPADQKVGSAFALLGLKNIDELSAIPEDRLQELFVIRVARDSKTEAPPLLGTYTIASGELQFVSRYPLSRSVKYAVQVSSSLTGTETKPLEFSLLSKPLTMPPSVAAVYPSADVLPENLLKFYIHFSAPMSRGEAYQRIHLMHEGSEVKDPFLELGEELWDVDQTRFTLFIHPGRIKRGVKPREIDGLPMTDGKEYSLHIDDSWLGANHQPLSQPFVKKFRIVAADDVQPNPTNWKIATPKANSRQPITLNFNEPLDHAMLNRVLTVRDTAGKPIAGKISIAEHETVWQFIPDEPWKRLTYAIDVATNLEDLCGNSIARAFETKMQVDDATAPATAPLIAIEFAVD